MVSIPEGKGSPMLPPFRKMTWSSFVLGFGLGALYLTVRPLIRHTLERCSIGIGTAISLAQQSLKDGIGGMSTWQLKEPVLSNPFLEYLGASYTLFATNGSSIVLVIASPQCDGSYRYICGGKRLEKTRHWEREPRPVTILCMGNMPNRWDRQYMAIQYMPVVSRPAAGQ